MRRCAASLAVMGLLGTCVGSGCLPEPPVADVALDPEVRHQTIDGIGGAAHYHERLRAMPEPARSEVLALVFTELQPAIVRLRIPHEVEPQNDNADPDFADPTGFVAPVDLVWLQQEIAARAPARFIAAPWSPPAWLKTTGQTCCGGSLRRGMEAELAEWLSTTLAFLAGGGHPLDSLSIQNEPEVIATWDTCTYSVDRLASASEAVAQRLARDGHATTLHTADTGASFMSHIYTPTVMAQPAAAARMEAIAFHLYQVVPYFEPWKTPEWLVSPLSMSEAYGLPAWMTEYSNVDRSYGTYEEAMALAQHLHYNLANGVSAYLIWNLYYPWSVGEALVHIDPNGGSAYTITPKYYTAKQYMRFVRPGAVRIEAGSDDPDVLVTAYLHDTEQTLVVVAINTAAEARTLAVATGLGALATPEVFRTSATENAAPIVPPPPDASGVQTLELPGQSVATLIWALR